jgi:hypothetical protein
MSVEAIRIESRWGPPDLDQMSEDPLEFVWILDDGDNFHLRAALWAHHRIDLVDLCKKPGPSGLRYRFANRWTQARLLASISTSSSASDNGS